MRYLWIVEIKGKSVWEPLELAYFNRENGRDSLTSIKKNNPWFKYRLVKYVPEEK